MEAPLITPTRSSKWSIDATTLRSTQTTRTTGAFTNGSVSRAGGGVRSMVTASTLVGSIVFQGLSPAWTCAAPAAKRDRKSTRLNSSHLVISYAVFCLKKKKKNSTTIRRAQQKRQRQCTSRYRRY